MITRRTALVGAVSLPIVVVLRSSATSLEGYSISEFEHHVTLCLDNGVQAQFNRYSLEHVGGKKYKVKQGTIPHHVFPNKTVA